MKLYCTVAGAVLLWIGTFPMGELAPQGAEVTIKVCRVGEDTIDIEKSFLVFGQKAGSLARERVCARKGEPKTEGDCWNSGNLKDNPDERGYVPQ